MKKFRRIFGITMGLCRAELYIWTHVFSTAKILGEGHKDIAAIIKDGELTGFFTYEAIKNMGKVGLEKLKDQKFVEENKREVKEKQEELWNLCNYINSLDIKHIPPERLFELFNKLFDKTRHFYGYFNVSQPPISFALEDEIAKKVKDIPTELIIPDDYTLMEKEEIDLIKIAIHIKERKLSLKKISKELMDKVLLHEAKYSFLASSENFDVFPRKYFTDRLIEMVELPIEKLNGKISEIKQSMPQEKREQIHKELELDEKTIHLLDVARYYSFQRMETRIYWTKALYVFGRFYREFARRIGISEDEIQYLMRDEINKHFKEGTEIDKNTIKERMKLCVYTILDHKEQILTGKEAEDFVEKHLKQEDHSNQNEVRGTVANKGIVTGEVYLLNYGKNMIKQIEEMNHGSILVTGNTRPDMIIACKKASAIVTDEGGILSHAALVSRELGIPCITATFKGTKIFKNGDIVEVDGDTGIVRKLN